MEAHSSAEYDIRCLSFKGRIFPNGCLIFSVFDETPHKIPVSRVTGSGSFIHPIPPVPPAPFFAPPPPPPLPLIPTPPPPPPPPSPPRKAIDYTSPPFTLWRDERWEDMNIDSGISTRQNISAINTDCCSVAQGKKEVKEMMDGFLRDFTRIMGSTFGEDHSLIDPLDTPTPPRITTPRGPSPLPAIELDGSLHIPGSFIQPPSQSPDPMDDYASVEKSQTPPHMEPLQTLHPGIWCDFCGKQIRGLRFKCQECPYYDLVRVSWTYSPLVDHRCAIVCKLHCSQSSPRQAQCTPIDDSQVQYHKPAFPEGFRPEGAHSNSQPGACRFLSI